MPQLRVRSEWLREHEREYPFWGVLMELFIANNSYAVIPAKFGPDIEGVDGSDIFVYEWGVDGPPPAFRFMLGSPSIVCVNYPRGNMTLQEFVDYVNDLMDADAADNQALATLLTQ